MTKIFMACIAGALFFTACKNESSSTVGTYEREDSAASAENAEDTTKKDMSEENESTGQMPTDTAKGADSSMVKKDSGTMVKPVKAEGKR